MFTRFIRIERRSPRKRRSTRKNEEAGGWGQAPKMVGPEVVVTSRFQIRMRVTGQSEKATGRGWLEKSMPGFELLIR